MNPDSCRERIMHIVNEIKPFLTEVRIHEHILSRAQLAGVSTVMRPHDRREHELAMARLKHNLCSKRIARYAAWSFQSSATLSLVRPVLGDVEDASLLTVFQPACLTDTNGNRLYQVVTFRHPVERDMQVGLVYGVWRGAISKAIAKTDDGGLGVPRKLRVAKAVPHELDVKLTSRVRLVVLARQEPGKYRCSCISPSVVIDPLRKISQDPRTTPIQLQLRLRKSSVVMNQLHGVRVVLP